MCLPRLSNYGGSDFSGCELSGLPSTGRDQYENNLIVTKNFVLPPENERGRIATEGFQTVQKTDFDVSRLRETQCTGTPKSDVCSGNGRCVIEINLGHTVEDQEQTQAAEQRLGHAAKKLRHMRWVCSCALGYDGQYCDKKAPVSLSSASRVALPAILLPPPG